MAVSKIQEYIIDFMAMLWHIMGILLLVVEYYGTFTCIFTVCKIL